MKKSKNMQLSIIIYILLCLICAISLSYVYTTFTNIKYETVMLQNQLKNSNYFFNDTSLVFNPYSYKQKGFENVEDFLTSIRAEMGEGFLGFTERQAAMHTNSSLGDILFSENFIFDENYFTLVKGVMPNTNLTSDKYVEALVGVNPFNTTTDSKLNVGESFNINFKKNEITYKMTIKIVGQFNNQVNYPTKGTDNINTFIPDFSKIIDLELLPSRGQNMYMTFTDVDKKKQAVTKLNAYGIVQEDVISETQIFDKAITENKSEKKLIILAVIIVSAVSSLFLFVISYNLYKNQLESTKKLKFIMIFLLPIFIAVIFFILSIFVIDLNLISKILSSLILILITELSFYFSLFQKRSKGN